MRGIASVVLLVILTLTGCKPVAGNSNQGVGFAEEIDGTVLVLFGEGVRGRSPAIIAGVEQALHEVLGVTVLVPRVRPHSLRDVNFAGVATAVEIVVADVVAVEDQSANIRIGDATVSGTVRTVHVRLGLRFLRVVGDGRFFEFMAAYKTEGIASGVTDTLTHVPSLGRIRSSVVQNLEVEAFRNAAIHILNQ